MNEQKNKSIWILNHHATTAGHRHYELACEFAKRGYQTIVFASSFSHETHQYRYHEACHIETIAPGVIYVYLRTTPAYMGNGVKRVLNMFSYLYLAKRYAPQIWLQYGKPDYVIGSCVHPLAWEAASWIARRCKAKFICEVRDFWPLSLIELSGMSKYHPLVLFFSIIERRAYRRAEKIVTTFPYGYQYICGERGFPKEKVFWMPNGIRIEDSNQQSPLPAELEAFLDNHWCCLYAGSFVKSECIDFMLEAFEQLQDQEIYFAIVGSGHEQANLEKFILEHALTHVKLFPRMSKPQVMTALRKAQCCLAAHENHHIYRYGLSMNKLNDYLLSGTPVIFACDAPNAVQETENLSIPYGNPHQLAEAILKVKNMDEQTRKRIGESGQRLIKTTYDYSIIAQSYIHMLEAGACNEVGGKGVK